MESAANGPSREAWIRVNGRPRATRAGTLESLLAELGYESRRPGIAVAVNGDVVARSSWGARGLAEGDEIDIVGAVQGG